jgi:hypothetical protein
MESFVHLEASLSLFYGKLLEHHLETSLLFAVSSGAVSSGSEALI